MKDDKDHTKNMSHLSSDNDKPWRFVTNHTQVLLTIARDPDSRTRDIAEAVGITERAAQRIVADLVEAGFLESVRVGRRNHYTVNRDVAMRHPAQANQQIGDLLDLLELDESSPEPDE
jgi:DNA-binding MarR family transcriptional regulator